MADIAERLGWGQETAPDELSEASQATLQKPADIATASEVRTNLIKNVATHSESISQTLDGLIRLVQLEKSSVEADRPNSDEGRREQKAKIDWFDKVLLGLEQIKKSLEESTPEKTVEEIEAFSKRLGKWYDSQEKWVQKVIRMTAIGSTALGLFSSGMPIWGSIAIPSMFFAKSELKSIKDVFVKE